MFKEIVKDKDGNIDWFLTNQANGLYTDTVRNEDGTYDFFPKWIGKPIEITEGDRKGDRGVVTNESCGFVTINHEKGCILKSQCAMIDGESISVETVKKKKDVWDAVANVLDTGSDREWILNHLKENFDIKPKDKIKELINP